MNSELVWIIVSIAATIIAAIGYFFCERKMKK